MNHAPLGKDYPKGVLFRYIDIFLLLISVLFGCYTQGSVPATMYGVMVARQTLTLSVAVRVRLH